jgi:DNA phosphorothioation-associated putative methyltransferase
LKFHCADLPLTDYSRARRHEGVDRCGYEVSRELLEPFMAPIAAQGRLPEPDGFPQAAGIENRFGSVKHAFALVKRVTGTEEWDGITHRCTEHLLVYLALGRFRRRPPMSIIPLGLKRDLRAFFGSYSRACKLADDVLFQAGNPELVDEA